MAFETVFKWSSVFCLEIIGNQNGKQNWRPDTETIGNRNWQSEWQPSLGLNQNDWHSNSDPTENRFCDHLQWRIFVRHLGAFDQFWTGFRRFFLAGFWQVFGRFLAGFFDGGGVDFGRCWAVFFSRFSGVFQAF